MANRYILPLYKELYDEDFSYADFDNRMQMQKAIYLLQEMGVPVGTYGFKWYKHGPYSQALQDDMYYENSNDPVKLTLSEQTSLNIKKLKSIINAKDIEPYSSSNWIECLASLHYLKDNILRCDSTVDDVISELERRKPHLDNHNLNRKAYALVEGLFS